MVTCLVVHDATDDVCTGRGCIASAELAGALTHALVAVAAIATVTITAIATLIVDNPFRIRRGSIMARLDTAHDIVES